MWRQLASALSPTLSHSWRSNQFQPRRDEIYSWGSLIKKDSHAQFHPLLYFRGACLQYTNGEPWRWQHLFPRQSSHLLSSPFVSLLILSSYIIAIWGFWSSMGMVTLHPSFDDVPRANVRVWTKLGPLYRNQLFQTVICFETCRVRSMRDKLLFDSAVWKLQHTQKTFPCKWQKFFLCSLPQTREVGRQLQSWCRVLLFK